MLEISGVSDANLSQLSCLLFFSIMTVHIHYCNQLIPLINISSDNWEKKELLKYRVYTWR
jgi:hypothetical protein